MGLKKNINRNKTVCVTSKVYNKLSTICAEKSIYIYKTVNSILNYVINDPSLFENVLKSEFAFSDYENEMTKFM